MPPFFYFINLPVRFRLWSIFLTKNKLPNSFFIMKILMFGWEFPPHISGGLGTACYGLTRGLASFGDIGIIFVVPKAYGDENTSSMELIGANRVSVTKKKVRFADLQQKIDYYEVQSGIVPYVGEEEFLKLSKEKIAEGTRLIKTDAGGNFSFSGGYGCDLMEEISKYAVVAETIAGDHHFDLIHAHDWLTYPAGIKAKKISGKPLVVHVHATDFDRSGGNINPRVYAIEKQGMEAADLVITVSNLTRKIVIERYGISPKKITTVYNAVEPVSHERQVMLGKGVDEKIVTFLGRITMQKGPEYFIEAASLVLKKMKNVRFVMAGSGDMMDAMVKRAAALGITDRFHFTGFLRGDHVFDMFSMSDVFVMPSVSEPFGIVPLEAIQSGVPVIISKQSGVSEILRNAIKVDYWNTQEMADAIYGLLKYSVLHGMLRRRGRQEVEKLKWVVSAGKVRELYREVLSGGDARQYSREL